MDSCSPFNETFRLYIYIYGSEILLCWFPPRPARMMEIKLGYGELQIKIRWQPRCLKFIQILLQRNTLSTRLCLFFLKDLRCQNPWRYSSFGPGDFFVLKFSNFGTMASKLPKKSSYLACSPSDSICHAGKHSNDYKWWWNCLFIPLEWVPFTMESFYFLLS